VTNGIPGFFRPNSAGACRRFHPPGADKLPLLLTAPLERTLTDLVDFNPLNE
jgi:NTE family protein